MDRRAIACFDQALTDAGFTIEPLRRVLHDYVAWTTRITMAPYPHPSTKTGSRNGVSHCPRGQTDPSTLPLDGRRSRHTLTAA
jgi:hypothetical protein